uniref:Uncharacterized protein n=1 Tax=Aegilops tauschii subsp. strangulata TaxID=200361 RepID=A0A453RG70_AEGTS
RSGMRKGGEDFMVHLLEASLLAFTILLAQKRDGRHRHSHLHEKVELSIKNKAYIIFLMRKISRYV